MGTVFGSYQEIPVFLLKVWKVRFSRLWKARLVPQLLTRGWDSSQALEWGRLHKRGFLGASSGIIQSGKGSRDLFPHPDFQLEQQPMAWWVEDPGIGKSSTSGCPGSLKSQDRLDWKRS